MNTLAIIQARTGSTRLPGKVLKKIFNKTVIEHVVERVNLAKKIDKVFVATTHKEEDLPLIKICVDAGFNIFCGSEKDVLDRFYQIAKLEKPKLIVRITSDCPVIDPDIIDLVITQHINFNADYTSNTMNIPFPNGQDVEVFSFDTLEKAWKNSILLSDREHVTPYIKFNKESFKLHFIESTKDLSSLRLTLDEEVDLKLIEIIYNNLYEKNNYFGMKEILTLFNEQPELVDINSMLVREAGYLKSLKEDA